jgi:hypothetical protein
MTKKAAFSNERGFLHFRRMAALKNGSPTSPFERVFFV